jgi:hypothetical protein
MDPDPRQGDADPQDEEGIKNVLIPIQHTVHTIIKGRWKRETMGVRKEQNVR